MKAMVSENLTRKYLIDGLRLAIMAEQVAGDFYRYISSNINNGRIKDKFRKFADEESETHKELLQMRLKEMTAQIYAPRLSDFVTDVKANDLSLEGAFKMAKKTEERAVRFYKKMLKKDGPEHKHMYASIIEDEKKHWKNLKIEQRFIEKKDCYNDSYGVRLFYMLDQIFK